jgi:NADPH:quinone reductase-like Zn-dependent oxidoreductase
MVNLISEQASGLKVVTTASPKNFDLLKSLGADAVFDYNDKDTPKKIKEWDSSIALGIEYATISFGAALLIRCAVASAKRVSRLSSTWVHAK